jgi:RNA recognition motif-containing protein
MDENKVFVGGLSFDTDSTGLRNAFANAGDVVDAKVIQDRETGRSRGFGFVTFGSSDAVTKAMNLNGTELDGRTIKVDRAAARNNARGTRF